MPGKMARSDPRPSVRVTRGAGSGQHLASVSQDGRENANIDAGLGFIWRISDYDKAVGQALGEASKELRDEIAALRRELATARNRIKALEQRRNVDAERRNRRLARQPQSLFGHAV